MEITNDKGLHSSSAITPPQARKNPKELTIHGDIRIDHYYWLNEKENPETIAYLEAENAYADKIMEANKTFREKLFYEMKDRIKEKDESPPVLRRGYYYYTRSEEGQQYFKYCRKKGSLDAPEEILLDVDEMAAGYSYFAVSGFNVSPDNTMMAFGVDTVSRRQYTVHIKNLLTGEILADKMYPSSGSAVWANDNQTLFYTQLNPETLLSEKIIKHKLFTPAAEDVTVYHEQDKTNYIGVSKTKSGKYIVIRSAGTLSAEVRFLDADTPDHTFKIFEPRKNNVLYTIDHQDDYFIILTNLDAKNFRLMEAPVQKPGVENWREMIAHREDVLIESIDSFKDFLVITERKDGLRKFRIRNTKNKEEHYLDFGEPAYAASSGPNPEYPGERFRYSYTSMTTPSSVFDYNMITRGKILLKQQEVVGGYDPTAYVTERLFAPAMDGAQIPISLVYKKGLEKNGKAPLLLYGYGSYGISLDASFNSSRLSLLNRGFTYAIAHVRGGQEMGRSWYESGKLMNKKNSFTDFIEAAGFLISEKYTSPGHLYAMGGSAGGLLMAAVSTMRPDLWNGIIASVPFVDVVTTMLDETIPLTTNEFDEWGNPKNKEAYEYMKSYSPYDNVNSSYPNMLVLTGLHDSQVQYFEPAKWVARIREFKSDNNLLLFHTNMDAGHGGSSGRFDYLKEVAMQYVFLFSLEGIGV